MLSVLSDINWPVVIASTVVLAVLGGLLSTTTLAPGRGEPDAAGVESATLGCLA